jgi:hypothetical protein
VEQERTETFETIAEAMILSALKRGTITVEANGKGERYIVTWTESGDD